MAFPVNSCDGQAIIDLLAKQPPGTYTKDVLEFNPFPASWWSARVKQIDYPMHMGPSPLRRVMSRQRGGEIVSAKVWHPSNGTGSAADNIAAGQPIGTPARKGCCPPVNTLNRGYLNKGLNTFEWAWQGRLMCASDFTQSLDPVSDLQFEFAGYGDQIDQSKAMFQRNEYIRLCTTKVYCKPGTGLFNRTVTSTVGDPEAIDDAAAYYKFLTGQNPTTTDPSTGAVGVVTSYPNYLGLDPTIVPTSKLNQDLVTKIQGWLQRNGVPGVAVINGAHQYELVTDQYTSDDLLRDISNPTYGGNAALFDYSTMGKGKDANPLLAGLGTMQMFRGAAYQVDPFALHLDANFNPVPATITIAADSGTEDVTNPNYDRAPFAVSIIYTDEVYNVAYPKIAQAPGGNVEFGRGYNYLGDLIFKVLPEVPLGDQGYFYSAIKAASWAGQQRFGVIIIHLGCNAAQFTDCSNVVTYY